VLDNVADGEGFSTALLVRSALVAATHVRTKKTLVYGQCTSDSPPRGDHRRGKVAGRVRMWSRITSRVQFSSQGSGGRENARPGKARGVSLQR